MDESSGVNGPVDRFGALIVESLRKRKTFLSGIMPSSCKIRVKTDGEEHGSDLWHPQANHKKRAFYAWLAVRSGCAMVAAWQALR